MIEFLAWCVAVVVAVGVLVVTVGVVRLFLIHLRTPVFDKTKPFELVAPTEDVPVFDETKLFQPVEDDVKFLISKDADVNAKDKKE